MQPAHDTEVSYRMRKLLALCFVLFISAIAVGPAAASKITTDPNVPGSTVANPTDRTAADERLARKITYESGYARLHAAADDLTRITGVRIRAGSSSKDWQIRDIPLVICVKDLPLGKLLSAIAESTHTLLSSTTLDSGVKVYRFYRNKRLQDAIDGKLKPAEEKLYEQVEWAWNAMLKLAGSPEAQAELSGSVLGRGTVAMAKLLNSLGPDAKDRVLSGETINTDFKDPSRALLAEDLFAAQNELMSGPRPTGATEMPAIKLTPEELAALKVSIRIDSKDNWTDDPMTMRPAGTLSYMLARMSVPLANMASLALPPWSNGEEATDHLSDPKLHAVESDSDWTQPALGAKVKMEAPTDKTHLAFADAVTALAKASGLNIVTEDFQSQGWDSKKRYADFFKSETTTGSVLKASLDCWFYNSDDKLLLCLTHSHGLWQKAHRNLVPESLVLRLTAKLDTTGEELDDVTPILSLTSGQSMELVINNVATTWLAWAFGHDRPLWQLYDSLSDGNKALAKSEGGFRLAALDAAGAATLLKDRIAQDQAEENERAGVGNTESYSAATHASLQSLLDPDVLHTAVMWIKSVQHTSRSCGDFGLTDRIDWIPELHHSYVMEIEYEKDGQKATLRTSDLGL